MFKSKPFLLAEFIVLCLLLPGYIIYTRSAPYMFTFLWGAAAYCLLVMVTLYFKGWRDLWRFDAVTWRNLKPILIRWVLAVIGMIGFLYFYNPSELFSLVLDRPQIVPMILLMYPILSALPQEFIFCSFFFKRYAPFFGGGWIMVLASAVIFAYAHILYINPVAPALSFLGGLIFALTYKKHHSLALVTIEHALYGNALFLIGLGTYFYRGNIPMP
jgi:uncharacterized protein